MRRVEKTGKGSLILHVGSADTKEGATHKLSVNNVDYSVEVRYGDMAAHLGRAADALAEVRHFRTHCHLEIRIYNIGCNRRRNLRQARTRKKCLTDILSRKFLLPYHLCFCFQHIYIFPVSRPALSKHTKRAQELGSKMSVPS